MRCAIHVAVGIPRTGDGATLPQVEELPPISHYGPITVDRRQWPVLLVRFPTHPVADAVLDGYIAAQEEAMHARDDPYALVVYIGPRPLFSPDQRRRMTAFMNRNRESIARRMKGYAYVVTHRRVRVALRAIFWFAPPPVAVEIFPTERQAIAWARGRLAG